MGKPTLPEFVGTSAASLAVLAEPIFFAQSLPDQAARQMNNVVQRNRLRVSLLEQFDAFFQVAAAITENGRRDAATLSKFLQLIVDDRPVGRLGGNQRQHIDVAMFDRTIESSERLDTDPQHDKALQRTCGDHVIGDPNAIGAIVDGVLDLVESDAQEIVLDGRMTEAIKLMTTAKLTDQPADSGGRSHRNGSFDYHPQDEGNQVDGEDAAGGFWCIE